MMMLAIPAAPPMAAAMMNGPKIMISAAASAMMIWRMFGISFPLGWCGVNSMQIWFSVNKGWQ